MLITLGVSMFSLQTRGQVTDRRRCRSHGNGWLDLWLDRLKQRSIWRKTSGLGCALAVSATLVGQHAFASDPADVPAETPQLIPVSPPTSADTEELAPPVSMMQAMADLHSRDAATAQRARQLLEQADLTSEQRRFAELVRHPEAARRVELLRLVERTEDRQSRQAILEFLKTSDPD
ncbi:MAG: hypothetical protein ISQ06_05260, partial [Planctomycetaceae bacterium]|nr:hypothetical protein [Planctomycetaceae bacterium]